MGKLFRYADAYLRQSTWKDLALIKFCLCAIGVLLGLCAAKKHRKPAALVAASVFIATYIPLMSKFFKVVKKTKQQDSCFF